MSNLEELMQPVSWRVFGSMLWTAFYFVSVVEIGIFFIHATRAVFFGKKVLWDRELIVLAISVGVVVCYHLIGSRKKPNHPTEPRSPSLGGSS